MGIKLHRRIIRIHRCDKAHITIIYPDNPASEKRGFRGDEEI